MADRVGFDQTAGSLVGMMGLEGGDGPPRLMVNDYIVSWLLAAGVVAALRRRVAEGGSWRVHASLTNIRPRGGPGTVPVTLPGASRPVRVVAPPGRVGERMPAWSSTTDLGADRPAFQH